MRRYNNYTKNFMLDPNIHMEYISHFDTRQKEGNGLTEKEESVALAYIN